jgi:hypothetical protein
MQEQTRGGREQADGAPIVDGGRLVSGPVCLGERLVTNLVDTFQDPKRISHYFARMLFRGSSPLLSSNVIIHQRT